MGKRIGIIAGSGKFPGFVLEEAQKQGYTCVVAGVKGEAEEALQDKVDIFQWIDPGEILSLVSFFSRQEIKEAVFTGKVDPRRIFNEEKLDKTTLHLLTQCKKKTPDPLIKTIIDFFSKKGIQVKDPSLFLSSFFCKKGILTKMELSPEVEKDIDFGWKIAKNIADLDIGQTVVVKKRVVVAVEGVEGTDEAIRRGGRLAGKDTVAVKVSRTSQDPRVDLPAVGLGTIEAIVEAGGRALCVEAEKMPFFQKVKAVALADENGISIVARKA